MELEELQQEIIKLKENNKKLEIELENNKSNYSKIEEDYKSKLEKISEDNNQLREHNNYLFRKVTTKDIIEDNIENTTKEDINDLVEKLGEEI